MCKGPVAQGSMGSIVSSRAERTGCLVAERAGHPGGSGEPVWELELCPDLAAWPWTSLVSLSLSFPSCPVASCVHVLGRPPRIVLSLRASSFLGVSLPVFPGSDPPSTRPLLNDRIYRPQISAAKEIDP